MEKIALLALGAYEQHGRHLPYETDSIIARAIMDRLTIELNLQSNFIFLPVQNIGYSPEHCFDAKSKSLSYSEAIGNIITIADRLRQNNIKKMLLINTHGGNSPIMTIAATEIRQHFNMLCGYTSWLRFGLPENSGIEPTEKQYDIHGGFIETSVMLYIAPDLVKMRYAENFENYQRDFAREYHFLRAYGPHAFGWMIQDLNSKGACGNALAANAAAGKAIFEHSIKNLILLIQDIAKFPIDLYF